MDIAQTGMQTNQWLEEQGGLDQETQRKQRRLRLGASCFWAVCLVAPLTHVWTDKIPLSSKVNGTRISASVCIEGQTAEQTFAALLHVEFAEDVKIICD